jgi:hypothetical protein
MRWVLCHRCSDWALIDDEDEETNNEDFAKSEQRAQAAVERNEKGALLYFISHCFTNNQPVPDWAKKAFNAACWKGVRFEIKSWDDVFGRPLKKGQHQATERRNMQIARTIWERVCDRSGAGEGIGKKLFDSIGNEFGVSGTVAEQIYYGVLKERKESPD